MKQNRLFIPLFILIMLITACGPAQIAVEEVVLTVGGRAYSQSELESLESISVDYTNKDGENTTYFGVSLITLLENADLTESGDTLVFTAADGYQADMPLEDALSCTDCIVAFDNGSLRMVMPGLSSKLQVKDTIEITVQ